MTALNKRAQVLMPPAEYARLKVIARQQRVSVAELMRRAVRERYLHAAVDPQPHLERLFAIGIPGDNWRTMDDELTEARGDTAP